jgi:acyl carrier protein
MTQAEVIAGMQEAFDGLFLEPVVLRADLSAKEVEEWDSLLHISIVVAIEMRFNVRFRVGEVEGTRNVGEFADLVVRRLDEQAAQKR